MTRQSLNIQFGLVAVLAIGASFATEVMPDSYELKRLAGFWWTLPGAVAVCRLFVVAYTSFLKNVYPKEKRKFDIWAWTITGLIAIYILHLWQFSANPIKPSVHWALQLLNVALVGSEFYYGRLMLKTKEAFEEEDLKDQIADQKKTIEANRQQIESDRETIELLSQQIETHRKEIGSNSSEIAANRLKIENQDSVIANQKAEIEKLNKAFVSHSKRIAAGQKLIAGITVGAGVVIACPSCGTPDLIGHAAKSKNCKQCKHVLK